MAFELRLAQDGLNTFVEQISPALQKAYRTSRRNQLVALGAVWVLFGALFVGVALAWLLHTDWFGLHTNGPILPAVAFVFVPPVAICWHQIAGQPARKVYGYCEALRLGGRSTSRSPAHSRPAGRAAASLGWIAGWIIGLVGLLCAPDPDAGAVRWTLAVVFAVLTLGLAVLALAQAVPLLSVGRDWLKRAEQRRTEVIGLDDHHVAVATAVEPVDTWLSGLPVFNLTIEWTDASGPRREAIRFADYPVWAPVPGTEFDVWVDTEVPRDPMRTFLERRLVDQPVPDDPKLMRAPGDGGDTGPGPVRPAWMGEDGLTPRGKTVGWVLAVIAVVCAGIGVAALAVTPSAFPALSGWQVGLVVAHAVFLALGAIVWIALCLRRRVIADHGYTVSGALALPFLSLFGIAIYVLGSDAVWDAAYDRGVETWAVRLYIASAVAGLVMYALFFVFVLRADRLFNAGIRVRGEEVAEAIRSHDPARIDDLYARTGYRAGILHGG